MGIAQAGLAFRARTPISDWRDLVARLAGANATEIPRPDVGKFDIRNHADITVQVFGDVCSGGSHGYAIVEHGARTRTRLQTTGIPPLIESGAPMAFETAWLSAPFYFEDESDPLEDHVKVYYRGNREILIREEALTRQMLYECLISLFGVCPWETELIPEYHFYKLTPKTRPWWKLKWLPALVAGDAR